MPRSCLRSAIKLFATPAVPALSLNDVECDDVPCPCGFGVVSSFVPLVHLGDPASFALVDRDFWHYSSDPA